MSTREKEITAAVAAAKIDIDDVAVLNAFLTLKDAGGQVEEIGIVGVVNALYGSLRVILGAEATDTILTDAPRATEVLVAARAAGARLAPEMERLLGMLNDLTAVVGD